MIWRLAALSGPVISGLAWLSFAGAPNGYLVVNASALVLGLLLIAAGSKWQPPDKPLCVLLVTLLFLPILTGPDIDGTTRWLPLGPAMLTTSLLTLPLLAVLLARARGAWLAIPAALALVAGILQPDASILLALAAIVFALGGANPASLMKSAVIGGVAWALLLRDRLESAPFVESVFDDAATVSVLAAMGLGLVLIVAAGTIWRFAPAPHTERAALLACMAALVVASLIAAFPTPLLGYGAASILGLSLPLALIGREPKSHS